MLGWNFYINNTQVNEPIGWDGVELKLQRSQNYIGLESVFSGQDLTFDGLGAQLIKAEFALNGPDGTLEFKIEDTCNDKVESTTFWLINLMFFSNTDGLVTVNASETGFSQKFKNRMDSVVSLDSLTSIDGTPLLPPVYKEIGLHSKAIVRQGTMDFETLPSISNIELTNFFDAPVYAFPIKFNRITSDSDNFQLPFNEAVHFTNTDIVDLNRNPYLIAPSGGKFKIKIKVYLNVVTSNHDLTRLRLVVGPGVLSGQLRTDQVLGSYSTNGDVNFNIDYEGEFEITLLSGEGIWLFLDTTFIGLSGSSRIYYKVTYKNPVNYLTFEDLNQLAEPSTARCMLIHDVFSRLCEIITDEKLSFKSEFFGLTNQAPFYPEDGCGSHTAITNGKNLRNMLKADGTPFTLSMSWSDFYKSCDAIWNIGMRIEYNSFGKGTVRVEPKSFFFKADKVELILSNVSGITIKSAVNYIYKSVSIGYEKWNLNSGSINGIDEFNTIHHYTLSLENANNSLDVKSKFIASGHVIELTRRVQYESNPTTDFETDDDNFFIALNPKPVESSLYSITGIKKKYKANTVSERRENFEDIENLISPDTAYNLRLSPARNLLRWWGFISSSLYFKIKQNHFTAIKFQSGEGNVLMKSTQTGDCKETSLPLQENQDIIEGSLDFADSLFIPVLYQFDYPIHFLEFNSIRKNSNLGIQFNCDGENSRVGFLEELTYKPVGGGNGIGTFTVLVAAGSGAAFDDGFSDGFDT